MLTEVGQAVENILNFLQPNEVIKLQRVSKLHSKLFAWFKNSILHSLKQKIKLTCDTTADLKHFKESVKHSVFEAKLYESNYAFCIDRDEDYFFCRYFLGSALKKEIISELDVSLSPGPHCKLPDGRFFVLGEKSSYKDTYILEPSSLQVQKVKGGPIVQGYSCVYFRGEIFIFGSLVDNFTEVSCNYKLDLEKQEWKSIASLPQVCQDITAVLFGGCIYVTGKETDAVWKYSSKCNSFEVVYKTARGKKVLFRSASSLYFIFEEEVFVLQDKQLKKLFSLQNQIQAKYFNFISCEGKLFYENKGSLECFENLK